MNSTLAAQVRPNSASINNFISWPTVKPKQAVFEYSNSRINVISHSSLPLPSLTVFKHYVALGKTHYSQLRNQTQETSLNSFAVLRATAVFSHQQFWRSLFVPCIVLVSHREWLTTSPASIFFSHALLIYFYSFLNIQRETISSSSVARFSFSHSFPWQKLHIIFSNSDFLTKLVLLLTFHSSATSGLAVYFLRVSTLLRTGITLCKIHKHLALTDNRPCKLQSRSLLQVLQQKTLNIVKLQHQINS